MSHRKVDGDAVLNFIDGWVADHGFPPTYREIAFASDVSLSTVAVRLEELKARGKVDWVAGRAGTLRVVQW